MTDSQLTASAGTLVAVGIWILAVAAFYLAIPVWRILKGLRDGARSRKRGE